MGEEAKNSRVNYGRRAGIYGIFGNCLLFVIKFFMGTASNSIALLADSFNNLMDCTGSCITVIAFHISGKKRGSRYPFGLGRVEYLCGLFIALIILSAAVSLVKSSVKRLISPEEVNVSLIMFMAPLVSVCVKSFLITYIFRVNKKLDSSALRAAMHEDCADILITALTILTLLAAPYTDLPVDGAAGLIIAIFIMWSGAMSLRENMDLIIGKGADSAMLESVRSVVQEYDVFDGIKSFTVHDYGPDARIAEVCVSLSKHLCDNGRVSSATAEVREKISDRLGMECVIYCDPQEISEL